MEGAVEMDDTSADEIVSCGLVPIGTRTGNASSPVRDANCNVLPGGIALRFVVTVLLGCCLDVTDGMKKAAWQVQGLPVGEVVHSKAQKEANSSRSLRLLFHFAFLDLIIIIAAPIDSRRNV